MNLLDEHAMEKAGLGSRLRNEISNVPEMQRHGKETAMKTLQSAVDTALFEHTAPALALGYLRYEALRKLNPRQYAELWDARLLSDKPFDHRVDELITKS
jgi:hypothetical protein